MYLIFDTETNGKADFKLPPEHPSQPRMVQLGAILLDSEFRVVAEVNLIVKPDGWVIPPAVAEIHGITQEQAEKYGMNEKAVLRLFEGLCARADVLVAHNIKFDCIVALRSAAASGLQIKLPANKTCTMEKTTPLCKLPGKFGNYKWPTMQEAHKFCFGKEFDGAHNAMADVRACADVFVHLCNLMKKT